MSLSPAAVTPARVQSVIDRPLHQRQAILKQAIISAPQEGYALEQSPVRGRIIVLTPGCIMPSGRVGSSICTTVQEVEQLAQQAVDNQVCLRSGPGAGG